MNELALPILAGLRLLAGNPFNCSGTRLFQLVVLLWMLFLVARLGISSLAVHFATSALRSLKRRDLEADYPELELARATHVQVLRSNSSWPPFAAVGFLSPKLLIDPAILGTFDRSEASAVLTHELAHIRRKDALTTAMVSSITSLFVLFAGVGSILYNAFPAQVFTLDLKTAAYWSAPLLVLVLAVLYLVEQAASYLAELACDRVACEVAGGEALASALIKAARAQRHSSAALRRATLALIDGPKLKLRVRRALRLSSRPKLRMGRKLGAAFAALLMIGILREVTLLRQLDSGLNISHCEACRVLSQYAIKHKIAPKT